MKQLINGVSPLVWLKYGVLQTLGALKIQRRTIREWNAISSSGSYRYSLLNVRLCQVLSETFYIRYGTLSLTATR